MTMRNAAARRPVGPLAGRPGQTLHYKEQTATADQEILAGPAETAEVNGTLGLNIYGNVGGTLQPVFTSSDMGQGSGALAWLTGNFTGTGSTQIAQTRDNNGSLQLLIYGDVGDGGLSTVFSNDISQIPFALAWVTGDFTGSGNTQILQPWMRVLA